MSYIREADGGFVMLETDGGNIAEGLACSRHSPPRACSHLREILPLVCRDTRQLRPRRKFLTGNLVITHQGALSGTLDTADSTGTSPLEPCCRSERSPSLSTPAEAW